MPALQRAPARGPGLGGLLLGWTGVSWGIAHVNGYYAPVALLLVLAGAAAVLAAVLRPALVPTRVGAGAVAALLVVTPLLHLQVVPPVAARAGYIAATVLAGLAAAGLGVLLVGAVATHGDARSRAPTAVPAALAVLAVAVLAVAALAAVVLAVRDPRIDVFTFLTQGSDGLLRGADLYRQTWIGSPGLTDVYPYLPGTALLVGPGRWLAGDVRVALVLATVVTALLLHRLARPAADPLVRLLPLLVLAYPRALLAAQNAWTEPLLLALLTGSVTAVLAGRRAAAVVFFGLALACKQHVALLLPIAALWPAFGWRRSLAAVVVAGLVVLPWAVAGPAELWHDTVTATLSFPVLTDALDLPALAARHGLAPGFAGVAAALAAAYLLCLLRLPRDATGFATGCALVLLAVDLTNKQSFFNHYTLVAGLLVLAAVLAGRPAPGADPVDDPVDELRTASARRQRSPA